MAAAVSIPNTVRRVIGHWGGAAGLQGGHWVTGAVSTCVCPAVSLRGQGLGVYRCLPGFRSKRGLGTGTKGGVGYGWKTERWGFGNWTGLVALVVLSVCGADK